MTSLPLTARPALPVRVARHLWHHHGEMWNHIARCKFVYATLVVLWLLAANHLGLNLTDSMPERLVWLEHGARPTRGDLVAFRFEGQGITAKFNGQRWFKRVAGVPGDQITVVNREVFINGSSIGVAAERSPRGTELSPIAPGVIPEGYLFLRGSSGDSLDSRYSVVGLVRRELVQARAHTIF